MDVVFWRIENVYWSSECAIGKQYWIVYSKIVTARSVQVHYFTWIRCKPIMNSRHSTASHHNLHREFNMNVTASSIATAVLSQFNKLPKKGKPTIKSNGLSEWTVLAGIVITSNDLSSPQCVALGTGLKCLPKIMLNHCGLAVNDSHAEVICRRNWQRYSTCTV